MLATLATSCQNEVLVEQTLLQEGQMFTLEVGRNVDSRTVLGENNSTLWSKGDQIFVCGDNGNIKGVMTLIKGDGTSTATFSGLIYGGSPEDLEHIVFPVPVDGKIDMSKCDSEELDAPMIGTIGGGTVQTLKNVSGLVRIKIDGLTSTDNVKMKVENATGGHYEFNPSTGGLVFVENTNNEDYVTISNPESGIFYLPVHATSTAQEDVDVIISVNNKEVTLTDIPVAQGALSRDNVPNLEVTNDGSNTSIEVGSVVTKEMTPDQFKAELEKGGNIKLSNHMILPDNMAINIAKGREVTLDLNGKKLSATSTQTGKNYDMILVKGNLTVENGTIETKHNGANMGWNSMTTIFDVTAGGVLTLNGVTAKNLGGSDMGFVAHLNNWGEVTLNVESSTLESNYVAVRVFNSGYDMNNVTINNSTLKGGSYAFWVHNYTSADFGTQEKADAQKQLLNFDISGNGNTLVGKNNTPVRYGFTNSVYSDDVN